MDIKAKAVAKYIRSSAQKTRLVADEIRGKKVGDAFIFNGKTVAIQEIY